MDRFWLLCGGLVILTYSLAHLYRIAAVALHIVDQPNHRSAHAQVTPTGAGAAFIIVFCIALYVLQLPGDLAAAAAVFYNCLPALGLVAVIGLADDLRPIAWWIRVPIHVLAAVWVIYQTGFPSIQLLGFSLEPALPGLVFGVIALVWLQNLFNFMDGIDGIAMGETVFVLIAVSGIAGIMNDAEPVKPLIAMIACGLGFLVINWPRARVFMGDAGSGFLGLMLGALALYELLVPVWSWLILMAWFITDACLTISLRLIRGEKIFEAHAVHAYQHLNRAVGTSRTLVLIGVINCVWLLPLAALANNAQEYGLLLLILASAPLLIFQVYCGAGQSTPKLMALKPD